MSGYHFFTRREPRPTSEMNQEDTETPEEDSVEPTRMSIPTPAVDAQEDQEPVTSVDEIEEIAAPPAATNEDEADPLAESEVEDGSELGRETDSDDDAEVEVETDEAEGLEPDPASNPVEPLNIEFIFPNGKDGAEYCVDDLKAELFGKNADDVTNYYTEGLENSGLGLDEACDSLCGTPKLEGNGPWYLSFTVYYHLQSLPRSRPYQHPATILINLDPTTLWKDLPSDVEVPYWKKDEDCGTVAECDGTLIAASKRGRSHAHVGSCRDDHFAIRYFHQTGWWLSIVADGAGSAKYSKKGSEIACEKGLELFEKSIETLESEEYCNAITTWREEEPEEERNLRKLLTEVMVSRIAYPSFLEIFNHAKAKNHRAKDYSTTFLFTAWKKLDSGWFVCSFSIGDGGIAVLEADRVTPMNRGDEGEFSGETVFLTTNSVWEDTKQLPERTYFSYFDDLKGIFAMTDGITDPKFETDHNFADFSKWQSLTAELETAVFDQDKEGAVDEKLLSWLDFWSPGNHDDRTLSIFTPRLGDA